MPNTDPELIGDFVADVEDLWEYGKRLDENLRILRRMRFLQHYEHLWEILMDIRYSQCGESSAHIAGLRKSLPRLLKALERERRGKLTAVRKKTARK